MTFEAMWNASGKFFDCSGFEALVPNPAESARLVVSAIESRNDSSHVTRNTPDCAMHLVVLTKGLQGIFWCSGLYEGLKMLTHYMKIEKIDVHIGCRTDWNKDSCGKINPYGDLLLYSAFRCYRHSKLRQLRFTGSWALSSLFDFSKPKSPKYTVDITCNELDDYFELTITRKSRS